MIVASSQLLPSLTPNDRVIMAESPATESARDRRRKLRGTRVMYSDDTLVLDEGMLRPEVALAKAAKVCDNAVVALRSSESESTPLTVTLINMR